MPTPNIILIPVNANIIEQWAAFDEQGLYIGNKS